MFTLMFSSLALVCLLQSVLAAPSSTQTASSSFPSATSKLKLNDVARLTGKKYFGTATDNSEWNDTDYVRILSDNNMFGQITPANSWKWEQTEPDIGNFTFADADAVAELAHRNGQIIRGHNCVWYNELPDWVTADNFTAPQLTEVMNNHCATLVGHFKGQTYAFDIVNEPFNDDGTWRETVFFDTIGPSFIPIVLKVARKADPFTKLHINEFNIEFAGPKFTAMSSLVASLKNSSVPLDGIGFQSHFIVGETPAMQPQLQQMADLGVEVAITELDIRLTLPVTDALLAQQKADYTSVAEACKAVKECVGLTLWDFTDKYSWVPSTFPGQGAPCPWDENLVRKPAYDGIVTGLL